MGQRGPVPKRSSERAGHRAKDEQPDQVTSLPTISAPRPDSRWGTAAHRWYQSLIDSGQARFFEPSDWEQARIICTLLTGQLKDSTELTALLRETRKLHRELMKFAAKEQDEVTRLELYEQIADVVRLIRRLTAPPAAAMMKEILKAMGDLGTTESARRRMRIEVGRTDEDDEEETALPPLSVVTGGR
jgi:hypothetical protein